MSTNPDPQPQSQPSFTYESKRSELIDLLTNAIGELVAIAYNFNDHGDFMFYEQASEVKRIKNRIILLDSFAGPVA